MRKFLINILKFIVLLLIVNHIIYTIGQKLYFDEYEIVDTSFHSYLMSDSHGVMLEDLPEEYGVHNFSNNGDSYFDMEIKLDYLIKNSPIDTLYISIDTHALTSYRKQFNNLDRSIIYTDTSHYSSSVSYLWNRYIHTYLVILQPKLGKILMNALKKSAKNGFTDSNNAPTKWHERSEKLRNQSIDKRITLQYPSSKIENELEGAFKRILQKCTDNNIAVYGIQFPTVPEYKEAIPLKSEVLEKLLKAQKGTLLKAHNEVFTPQEFRDQDHLNKKGATKFNELLFKKK